MRAAFSLDGEDSPTFASARRRGSLGGRPSYGRRCAHEFAREGGYERDTTFYSEMAACEAPHTSIRGLSTSLDRARSERLSSGAPSWHGLPATLFPQMDAAPCACWAAGMTCCPSLIPIASAAVLHSFWWLSEWVIL